MRSGLDGLLGRSIRLSLLPAMAILLIASCTIPLNRPHAGQGQGMRDSSAGWKVVSRKIEPSYLIAADGSECTVSRERWENVRVGTRAFCVWG